MKTLTRVLSLAVIALMCLTSCDNNKNNDTVTEQSLPGFFAIVEDITSNATAVYSNVGYMVRLNYTNLTADVQISGLKLPDGTSYPTMSLTGLSWSSGNQGWKVIKGTNVQPSGVTNAPVFNSFQLSIYERIVEVSGGQSYEPGVCANFTVNSIYRVLSSYVPQALYGKTTSKAESGSLFESYATEYVVNFNTDTRLLNIQMNGARFDQNMPASFNIELRNIPVTVRGGALTFDVAAITPYINDTPFEAFPITELKGDFNPANGLDFTFICTPRTASGSYTVTVDTDYSLSSVQI